MKKKRQQKIELVKTQLQIETTNQTANNAEEKNTQLLAEIQKQQLTQTETEKRAAISAQRAADLREALAKAEKRIKSLEQKGEARQRK